MMSYQQARCRLVSANEKRSKTCIAMRVLKGAVVTYFAPSPKKQTIIMMRVLVPRKNQIKTPLILPSRLLKKKV
jgi:hypothetical protein